MFEMRLDRIVEQIVRHAFFNPDGSKEFDKQALYVVFDVSMSSAVEKVRQRRGIHLLYHSRNGNYISVFSAVSSSPFVRLADINNWKHEVTHDSCWRDIKVITQTYFTMAGLINKERVERGWEEEVPIQMSQFVTFGGILRKEMFQWVPAEVKIDPACEHNYRKLITLFL